MTKFYVFRFTAILVLMVTLSIGTIKAQTYDTLWLNKIDLSKVNQDYGTPRANLSVDKHPLTVGGVAFKKGLGTHAAGLVEMDLKGTVERFKGLVGIDDEKNGKGTVVFVLVADKKEIFRSPLMKSGMQAVNVDVNLKGVKKLSMIVEDGGDGNDSDHADWVNAYFLYKGALPVALGIPQVEPYILTPAESPKPRINSAKVFGVRPGNPFMYTIAATGTRPMTFSAENLPEGLKLDPSTGIITGKLMSQGETVVTLKAKNTLGIATKKLKIVVGDKIALTPPLGWNSWNCFASAVDQNKVKAAADAMVNSGLINHGWTYVNIDDCWEIKANTDDPTLSGEPRDANGMINTNKKFPDMKALTDYIHSKGLKAGLYSSPGPTTCAGFTASYQFEDKDAQRWAEWGFDYIKYDWCSYGRIYKGKEVAEYQKPYVVLRSALDKVKRDIVFSFCQYGMGDVWKWGEKTGGNSWRTTGDITDTWSSMSGIGFNQNGHELYAGPGHWNDPDMLVVGMVGWGPKLHPSRLNTDEQYTHISLWSLLDSPLLIGCDMTRMDAFTKNLLTNDEVIAINQDPLGRQASRVYKEGGLEIWVKDMEDGSKAVGMFNRSLATAKIRADWSVIGVKGKQVVRDAWRQKDLGQFTDSFATDVAPHGVKLVTIRKAK
ncbi:MAG: NPCBM/NEW2 domain-containing protein [Bacteroidota bacterium]|nr:NPCBM/NEW2 domain-containing protein [Bacteroidota bacterium]